jgi:glycosyltransferase involved in cell wall biosynthesis
MKYEGCVEAIDGGQIVGWCIAQDAPHQPQFVSVYAGDFLIGTARANLLRPDLLNKGASGFHGFSFPISEHLSDGNPHLLSVFGGPGMNELSGSPIRIRIEYARTQARRSSGKYTPLKRAAVVCWDLAHNSAQRGHLLAKLLQPNWNVELIGPIWRRFGADLWTPLKKEVLTIKSFQPASVADVWREGARIALTQAYDLVIVCAARLPGLIVGLLIAEQSRCPIIVDIDEYDQASATGKPRTKGESELFEAPDLQIGADIARQSLHVADAITVPSPSLQQHFFGRVVRHARDESSPRADRSQARRRFGFAGSDFVIVLVCSAQSAKGLVPIFSALRSANDPSIKLLLAGSTPGIERMIKAEGFGERVILDNEFGAYESDRYLAAADLMVVLRDLDGEVSNGRIPMEVAGALQYGLRIAAMGAPPLSDLIARGVVDIVKPDEFANYLAKIRAQPPQMETGEQRQRLFEEEFSFAINRPRLALAIHEACAHFDPTGAKVAPTLRELLAKTQAARVATKGITCEPHRHHGDGNLLDFAFFWKQNDSDLFGRRSDMVVKYLLASGQVGKIVHFDHALAISDLRSWANTKRHRRDVAAMQLPHTIDRALELADEEHLRRRLFISRQLGTVSQSFAGRVVGVDQQYADFVDAALRGAGLDPANTIAWVCPVVRGFGELNERLGFRKVIADLIDDERGWPRSESELAVLQAEYDATLRAADLVFTNCEGNRQRFAGARADIVVVPNGAEINASERITMPEPLRALRRPIVGYLGNLRERIDWELLRLLTGLRPSWSVVLAGPVEEEFVPAWVKDQASLLLPGPVPYEESRSWMGSFDVAIVPHLRSPMTEAMNPLKLYNYLAAGTPVVATPVSNIDDVADLVSVADTPEDFLAAIDAILARPPARIPAERLGSFSWKRRVDAMLEIINKAL